MAKADNATKITGAAAAGVALGAAGMAAASYLSKKENRQRLAKKINELRETGQEKLSEIKENLEDKAVEVKDEVETKQEEAQIAAHDVERKANTKKEEVLDD